MARASCSGRRALQVRQLGTQRRERFHPFRRVCGALCHGRPYRAGAPALQYECVGWSTMDC
eukprot:6078898-Lingulodinium_polyedra.AAC.1